MISFAAGQAGFTVVVIILFNIIEPTGWKVGLTRIEDVAIGCAVSIVVGLLFWPRGATAALGRALSDAFVASSGYLADAVDRLTSARGRSTPAVAAGLATRVPAPRRRVPSVPRRTWRQGGAGRDVASLFTGSNRIRLAASRCRAARAPVARSAASWDRRRRRRGAARRVRVEPPLVRGVRGNAGRPAATRSTPPSHDATLRDVLRTPSTTPGRHVGRPAQRRLRMLWADELLENQRPVQAELAESADLFVRGRAKELMG